MACPKCGSRIVTYEGEKYCLRCPTAKSNINNTINVDEEIKSLIQKYNLKCSIEEFENKVNWDHISRYEKISEPFIEKFQNKVHWHNISIYQQLSEPFIEKFQDKVDWDYISAYQKLSEPFIEKFKNRVNWIEISIYQNLSPAFRQKYNLN